MSKKTGGQKNNFQQFGMDMFPGLEEMLNMTPMPGMEEDFDLARMTIESIMSHDFSKPIDDNNVCGHKAPGVEMKEGYCLKCYDEQGIEKLIEYVDLAMKLGPEAAARMVVPPPPPPQYNKTSRPSTSGASTSGASTSGASTSGASTSGPSTSKESASDASASASSTSQPSPKKTKKTDEKSQ